MKFREYVLNENEGEKDTKGGKITGAYHLTLKGSYGGLFVQWTKDEKVQPEKNYFKGDIAQEIANDFGITVDEAKDLVKNAREKEEEY